MVPVCPTTYGQSSGSPTFGCEDAEQLGASKEAVCPDRAHTEADQFRECKRNDTVHGGRNDIACGVCQGDAVRKKQAVARTAARLFNPGDTLFINAGAATLAFAYELATQVPRLTVVTNSWLIAQAMLRAEANHRVFVLGGEFRGEASESVGPLVVAQIEQFKAIDAVINSGAIDDAGLMVGDLQGAEIARAMISQTKRVTALSDSAWLSQASLFSVCSLSNIDRLVTDEVPNDNLAKSLAQAGVEVCIAH